MSVKKLTRQSQIGGLFVLLLSALSLAQSSEPQKIGPSFHVNISPAVVRTPSQMNSDQATAPLAVAPAESVPFRPTIDPAEYNAAKQNAARAPRVASRYSIIGRSATAPLAPPVFGTSFEGANQTAAGGLFPPDTHGAVGLNQFVEVTNSLVTVYNKAGALLSSRTLNNFFGYSVETLFDPRVVYDTTWNRWVITADAFAESTTVQRFFFAISLTSDANGGFFIYNLNVEFTAGEFFDFPQLGISQDAVIFTANVFPAAGGSFAELIAVAKAVLYNGRGFSVPVFRNLIGTLAPPVVLDQNATAMLIAAPPNSSALQLYRLNNASNAFQATLTGPTAIAVPAYTVPPHAPQPAPCTGTANTLDTGDNRFQNASTQLGNFLYQVHDENLVGFATPRFYKIDTTALTVPDTAQFFASGTSHDFNPAIATDPSGNLVVTWTSTDPPAARNADVRFGGKRSTDGLGDTWGGGTALFTSAACITGNFDPNFGTQRWGDYSAVSFDPATALTFFLVNEKINSANVWGSRIGSVHF